MAQNFKNLRIYREAYLLAKDVYNELKEIDKHFRLKDQLFGSTTSVCANIAEMSSMDNKNQQRQKITICIGEANETEVWLDLCKDFNLISEVSYDDYLHRNRKIRMMLYTLKNSLKY
ncbi:MAG: four helix bundle protein [Candidatus Altiarchaeales archaeon]|nr:four helix bundle protein [Candidatus Altiarchaeales archaeon]